MNTLDFATGIQTFSINDSDATITFNPTDSYFASRLFSVFEAIDAQQKEAEAKAKELTGAKEVFDYAQKRDEDTRALLDELFGEDFCQKAFGYLSVHAIAEGLPLWVNLLFAIIDKMDATVVAEQKKTNPRLDKYLKKYGR